MTRLFQAVAAAFLFIAGAGTGTATAQTSLIVYTALDTAPPAVLAYTKKTGQAVQLVRLSTGELLGKIAAEGAKPQFDLLWIEGSAVMRRLADDRLLAPMPAVAKDVNYTAIGRRLVPGDAMFLPTSMSGTAIAINSRKLPDARVERWADLVPLAGKVAAKDPNFSGPAFQWLAGFFQTNGETAGKALLASALTTKALSGIPSGGAVNKQLITGDAAAAIQQDTAILALMARGEPIRIVYPADGVVALPATIALSATSTKQKPAEDFVRFILSAEGQAAMQSTDETDTFFAPLIDGVKAKAPRTERSDWVLLDDKAASAREAEWKRWYKDSFVP